MKLEDLRRQEQDDLRAALRHAEGRRLLARIIDGICQKHVDPFVAGDALSTARELGRRSVGLALEALCFRTDPASSALMWAERWGQKADQAHEQEGEDDD